MWIWMLACVPERSVALRDVHHDFDGDGFTEAAGDCDDADARVNPNAVEICGDGVAQRCGIDPSCALVGDLQLSDGFPVRAGCPVAGAGDVNGDGRPDIVVGDLAGGASVVDVSGAWLLVLDGSTAAATAVAGAGDLDGDGLAEVLVGRRSRIAPPAGEVWWVPGRAVAGELDLATAPEVVHLLGPDHLGHALSGGLDASGDGAPDVLLGAPTFPDDPGTGAAFLLASPPASGENVAAVSRLQVEAATAGGAFGVEVALAHDLDGDGIAEVLVASEAGPMGLAEVWVIAGGSAGIARREDAVAIVLAPIPTAGWALVPAGPGDVDGDGLGDLLVGAALLESDAGQAALFTATIQGEVALAEADITWVGPAGSRLGQAVSGAGDVDGDGRADVLLGAPLADAGVGATYLLVDPELGSLSVTAAATATLHGAGDSVASAGDVDGDGYDDVLAADCELVGTSAATLWLGGARRGR